MDIASLNIKVTQSGVQEGASGLSRLKTEAQGAAKSVDQIDQSSRKASGGVSALSSVTSGAANAIKSLIGGYAALQAVGMADQFVLLKGRVEQSTRSVEEADQAWAGLLATAKETGQLEASINIFQRLSFVRDEIKATTDEMLQFTETVNKLGIVAGASQDALKFGLTQLGQSLSSDIVRAEEFNSIMENIPSVGRAIADELGITTGELRRLVVEGKVASEDVFAAILNQTEKAREQYEQMPMTVGRAWQQFKIALMESLGLMNENTGATSLLIGFLYRAGEAAKALGVIVSAVAASFNALTTLIGGGFLYLINLGIEALNKFGDAVADVYNSVSSTVKWGSFGKVDIGQREGANFQRIGGGSDSIINEMNAEQARIGSDLIKTINTAFPGKDSADEKSTAVRQITTDYKKLVEGLKEGNKEEDKAAKLIQSTISNLKFKNEQMARSVEDQEVYNQLRQANVDIDSAAGQEIENLVRLNQQLKSEQDNLNKIVDAGEGAFKKLWLGAIKGGQDFRDSMRSIVDDVAEMFYDMVIKSQIQNLMKGAFSGGSSGSSGFSFGNISGALSGAFDWIGGLFGFADGGSFQVGGAGGTDSQLVAFRASPDETVTITKPGQDGGSSGAVAVHYNIDARGADAGVEQRLMRAISTLDRTLESRALNAVDTQFKRNPKYGSRA
jgi:tape measure domain-containing protein